MKSIECFTIDLAAGSQSDLEAHPLLSLVDAGAVWHVDRNLRPPLGIYNMSVSRVCRRLIRLCEMLTGLCEPMNERRSQEEIGEMLGDLADQLELSFYACAEHVDDLHSIADNFFLAKPQRATSDEYRKFSIEIKQHKRLVSAVTNAIKHKQARLRGYAIYILQAGKHGVLPGYYIEGVNNGVVGPNAIFHGQNGSVFSATNFVWHVIIYLLRCSRSLNSFLKSRTEFTLGPASVIADEFSSAVISASLLPGYGFDDTDPFLGVNLTTNWDEDVDSKLEAGLPGSPRHPWTKFGDADLTGDQGSFVGDGVTRAFKITRPSTVSFRISGERLEHR